MLGLCFRALRRGRKKHENSSKMKEKTVVLSDTEGVAEVAVESFFHFVRRREVVFFFLSLFFFLIIVVVRSTQSFLCFFCCRRVFLSLASRGDGAGTAGMPCVR